MLTLHSDKDHNQQESIAQSRMPCILRMCQVIIQIAGACSPVNCIMLLAGACSPVSTHACMMLMRVNRACPSQMKHSRLYPSTHAALGSTTLIGLSFGVAT